MTGSLIADTGGLLRALAAAPGGAPSWPDFANVLQSASVVVVPSLVLAEIDYFLGSEREAMRRLIAEVFDPKTTYEYELALPTDLVRALEIDEKFADLELGLVDGTIAAVAERRRIYRVLTTDRRDFGPVRIGARYTRALELVP